MDGLWFVAKKLVSRLVFPVGLILGLGLAGGLLRWLRPRSRSGGWLLALAGLLLFLLASPLVSHWLVASLEAQAGDYADPARLAALGVRWVVVLAGGVNPGDLTPGDRLGRHTLKRLLEGLRLWRALPGSTLILSGGAYPPGQPEAEAMAALARDLGAPEEALVLETASWDTEDQARILAARLGREPFALVTSAAHLPRALIMFRAHGAHPQPAPADFQARKLEWNYELVMPTAAALAGSEAASYEYVGLTWLRLRGALGLFPAKAAAP
ncbi:MAG: YdcF family protein [Desulfarculus sp.]|nr:YdcF family protein [Desulfarculus sp.]